MSELRWPFLPGRNIHIQKAEGIYLYTKEGQEIIDAAGGAIVACIGHGNERVVQAVAQATRDTSYVVPPWLTPSREAMLEALSDWLPASLSRVHCTSGGSESNEAAIKIALHYQQAIGQTSRTEIIGRSIGYHGTTLATASISGHPGRKKGLEAALPRFLEVDTPYPLRCPQTHNQGDYYVDQLLSLIEDTGPEKIAAFLSEPITGSSGGAIVPPDEYWPRVREICNQYGILLIVDEVMTGFGRTGRDFGFQHWPIEPDILVGGKGLAGGYAPLGGVFAQEKIGAAIEQAGYQVMFNTFGAHPAACAAAGEVLTIMREEDLVQGAHLKGEYFDQQLHAAFSNHPHVAEVRGKGLLKAIEVVANRDTLERFPMGTGLSTKIVVNGLKKGVFFYGGGTGDVRDIVCMGPPLTIENAAIDRIVQVLLESVDEAIAAV
ncbi:MAG: aminotransferase class III-fold pyridoxal phosphate-dependent enzyme [Pseudomonadota bacterium]|nr:aminotransferase class III-fold pyridoxal phosphate-dependent enzyme [Pseudomonadota bacterium]